MRLKPEFFEPFDQVYKFVTELMRDEAAELPQPDQKWLQQLIKVFRVERDSWNDKVELDPYRVQWSKLQSRIMRLVAGAYLHVAYDLPRCLADEWPGQGAWNPQPSVTQGEKIYSQVRSVFPRSLQRAARSYSIVGYASVLLRFLTPNMLKSLNHWLLHLRLGAWAHARQLATDPPQRAYREAKMATAMAAALKDVSDLKLWTYGLLEPPDDAVYSPMIVSILALAPFAHDLAQVLAVLAGVMTLFELRARAHYRSIILSDFIWEFGQRVNDYVAFAVADPEGFDAFLAARRLADGLSEPAGQGG